MLYNVQRILMRVFPRIRGFFIRVWIIFNGGECGNGLIVEKGFRFKYPPHKGIKFANNVYFGRNTTLDVPRNSTLTIGYKTAFTGYTYLSAAKEVRIGDDVIIGEFVSIRDANHFFKLGAGVIQNQPMNPASIILDNDIWIGRGCVILKGVTIGSGAVVGANSVVKTNIVPNSVNIGMPAKEIDKRK